MSAFGAMDAVRNRGLVIPDDISLVGFDDLPSAAAVRPSLTTVHQPLIEMGRVATQMLLEYIGDPALRTRRIEFDTELVIRESCCPPKR